MKLNVLIVDDDADFRSFAQMLCSAHPAIAVDKIRGARDGGDGLRAIAGQRPDLIITDMSMPGMDGIDFVRAVRSDTACHGIKVIMMSDHKNNKERALRAGADVF